jgi:hypothetical protein
MIKVLKVEIHHGISFERQQNESIDHYSVSKSSTLGAPTTYYVPNND